MFSFFTSNWLFRPIKYNLFYGLTEYDLIINYLQVQRSLCSCLNTEIRAKNAPNSFLSRNQLLARFVQRSNVSTGGATKVSKTTGPVSWKGLLFCLIAGGGVVYYVKTLKSEKEKGMHAIDYSFNSTTDK